MYKTNLRLSSFSFTDHDIHKTTKSFNASKAHGYDDVSIRIFKISDYKIMRSLLMFKNCIRRRTFPNIWKQSNLVSVHKKVINRILKIIFQFLYINFWEDISKACL